MKNTKILKHTITKVALSTVAIVVASIAIMYLTKLVMYLASEHTATVLGLILVYIVARIASELLVPAIQGWQIDRQVKRLQKRAQRAQEGTR